MQGLWIHRDQCKGFGFIGEGYLKQPRTILYVTNGVLVNCYVAFFPSEGSPLQQPLIL
jgi:hypothetical protein